MPAPELSLLRQARLLYTESRELSRQIQAQDRQAAAAAGLTSVGAHALRIIEEACGTLTMQDLARELRIRRSTVTRLVDDLEAKRLVRRRPNPRDRRQIHLETLADGRERLETHLALAEQMQREVLARMSPSARQDCTRALHEVRIALERWNEDHLKEL